MYRFYDIENKVFLDSIWDRLYGGLWKDYNIDQGLLPRGETQKTANLFPSIIAIYPGYALNIHSLQLKEQLYYPTPVNADINSFLSAAEQFFRGFANQKIGVHLSGGLDSSLIICLLKHLNIDFVAIGLTSNRYEFRTESVIQHKLLDYAETGALINIDDYPFFSGLSDMPKHPIPDTFIKMHKANTALANEFAKRGVTTVLTGQGGDTLFGEEVDNSCGYNIESVFKIPWEQEYIYGPLGIDLISFYADYNIINQIHSLRKGLGLDPRKLWCRNFFRGILPSELADYCYTGNFFGYSTSGLVLAKRKIVDLFEEAYVYSSHPAFSMRAIKEFKENDLLNLSFQEYSRLCAKISIAVWYHALFS